MSELVPSPHVGRLTRLRRAAVRAAFFSVGILALVMAVAGALLPGIPTTPWVLLASYCFARSSERFDRFLRRTPFFGRVIADWEQYRGVRRPIKILAVCTVASMVSISILFFGLPAWVKWVIAGCAVTGISTILFLVPTARPEAVAEVPPKSE